MSFLIGNARIDENNKAYGGTAGDQTGKEVQTQAWYSYPWNCVVRAKDSAVAEKIAQAMEYACANDNIGYDQYQRTTLYAKMAALGWYPGNLAKVGACETDCSALVAVCVTAAGVTVSKDIWTGNEAESLLATGKFEKLTDSKYLTSYSYLKRGDILINTQHHTAIALGTGTAASSTASASSGSTASSAINCAKGQWYTNGSTEEPVYQTSALTDKIGTLNAYEKCYCFGKADGAYLVCYQIDGTSHWKAGYVSYAGGTTF